MIWIEMVCDGCNVNPYGEIYRKGAVQTIKDEAKQHGWKTIEGKIYCPECQQKILLGQIKPTREEISVESWKDYCRRLLQGGKK